MKETESEWVKRRGLTKNLYVRMFYSWWVVKRRTPALIRFPCLYQSKNTNWWHFIGRKLTKKKNPPSAPCAMRAVYFLWMTTKMNCLMNDVWQKPTYLYEMPMWWSSRCFLIVLYIYIYAFTSNCKWVFGANVFISLLYMNDFLLDGIKWRFHGVKERKINTQQQQQRREIKMRTEVVWL